MISSNNRRLRPRNPPGVCCTMCPGAAGSAGLIEATSNSSLSGCGCAASTVEMAVTASGLVQILISDRKHAEYQGSDRKTTLPPLACSVTQRHLLLYSPGTSC